MIYQKWKLSSGAHPVFLNFRGTIETVSEKFDNLASAIIAFKNKFTKRKLVSLKQLIWPIDRGQH